MSRINLLLVIGEILTASMGDEGVSKREIEYDLNLESDLMNNFLQLLKEKGLIKEMDERFFITGRGRNFLKDYEEALDME